MIWVGWCCDSTKKARFKKRVSSSFLPGVLSVEAVGTYHCLSPFHAGLAHTKVQPLGRDIALDTAVQWRHVNLAEY